MTDSTSLPSHASVVVIGGGAMGCSTLYHLAHAGVTDAVLLERQQLTSGTTWHSAAQVRQLRSTRNLTRLIQHSAALYASLEAETGQSTGWRRTGSLSLATNADRWIHIRRQAALARAYGVDVREVTVEEARGLWPLLNTSDVLGAVFTADDGRVNPSDLCLALSKGARSRGARIFEHTAVTGFSKMNNQITAVHTDNGTIQTERVALCAGLWSRDVALQAGADVPLWPCEHFYLLTQPMAGVDSHLPTLSDHDAHLYLRDDVGGLLVGCFEPNAKSIDPHSLGDDFSFGLLNEDWEHFEPMLRNAIHRIPALEHAQTRMLLNGPESFTPDGAFMLGESPQVNGLFLGCGMNSMGVASSGGAGWALAQWIANGAAPFELWETHPARMHRSHNRTRGLVLRAPEVLGRHYEIAYPGRQWQSDRNLRLSPLHQQFADANAQFGQIYGFERPLYFGGLGEPSLTFARPAWFQNVAREVKAANEACALFDLSTFGKIEVTGRDAEQFMDFVCTNDMTRSPGRAIYSGMLNERGGFVSDFTVLRTDKDRYLIYTGTTSIARDMTWLQRHRSDFDDIEICDVTEQFGVLAVMGPNALAMLTHLGATQLNRLPYFSHCLTMCAKTQVRAARISYVGEMGFELSFPLSNALHLYRELVAAGACPAGLYAQSAMRIEKRYVAMGHELDGETTPYDAGLSFAVKRHRNFVGSDALAALDPAAPRRRLMSFVIDDEDAHPLGDEPIYHCGELVGQCTSAAFGHRVGRPIALGFVRSDVDVSSPLSLDIAGTHTSARACDGAVFDPLGLRLRTPSPSP